MAKKKKTQLKPVVRAFATTSVPKKVVQNAPPADQTTEPFAEEETIQDSDPAKGHITDEQSAEDRLLQALIEKLHDKTEKEVSRACKSIELDRQFSKSLPQLELDQTLVNQVLELVSDLDSGSPEQQEEKGLSRLGITYGTLRRLGYESHRAEECLRNIKGFDLDEAYEWLCLHGIDAGDDREYPASETKSSSSHGTPQTPRTPSQFLASQMLPSQSEKSFGLDANAPEFVPTASQMKQAHPTTEPPTHSENHPIQSNGSETPESDFDTDNPSLMHAMLKLKYDDLSSNKNPRTDARNARLQGIRARLSALEASYFFDEREAADLYQQERKRVNAEALAKRLRGLKRPSDNYLSLAATTPPSITPQAEAPSESPPIDVFDDDDDNEPSDGLLGLLDGPFNEENSQGITISSRDMALPKHWSGRTPKTFLKEAVAKMDRYAVISYNIISGSSRARRAAVSIRWEGRKMDEWLMENVACLDDEQAEQYIATMALHALTFPPTVDFGTHRSSPQATPTFFRLLPPKFRGLWDELDYKRKERDNADHRALWRKLRSIIKLKLDTDSKENGRSAKSILEAKSVSIPQDEDIEEASSQPLTAALSVLRESRAYQDMFIQRNELPIASYREEILQALEKSRVLVLSGETGCGKSTQVPTFVLEDQLSRGKPCRIYCTEPRRISAISLAQRVSRELGEPVTSMGGPNSLVGYSIRLESNTSRNTRLTFVTNGIALRMLEGGTGQDGNGTAFDNITHIIVDEVHERTIESDFLLIVLKSLLDQRPDLRVILMSATVDAEKFSNFFDGCPTLSIPGRTYPVDVRFLEDAVECTKWSLEEGSPYARQLHGKFYRNKKNLEWSEDLIVGDDEEGEYSVENQVKLEKRYSPHTAATINNLDERLIPYHLILRLLEEICFKDQSLSRYSAAVLIFMPGIGEIRRLNNMLNDHPHFSDLKSFRIYPLHSTLSSEDQGAVFEIPPPGIRKIVIATNIAETGITIPDITCVVDTGKHREMRFDEKRQISRLVETFIARSNAAQRRGRAGRVQPGLCFHLFTKFRHDVHASRILAIATSFPELHTQLADHPLPEMMRLSLSDLALRIKITKVKLGTSIEDVLSRALDPPVAVNVQRAISMLIEVRALTPNEDITPMGRLLSKLPVDVHLGKFLLVATMFRCLDPALTIAATLSSKSPFVSPIGFEGEAERAKQLFRTENSDFLTFHNAFASWRRASVNQNAARKFCRTNYLSQQNLQQIEELRQQLLGYLIDSSFIQVDRSLIKELNRARHSKRRTRFVQVPADLDMNSTNATLLNAALVAGLFPKVLIVDSEKKQLRTVTHNQQTHIHPTSINFGRKLGDFAVNHLTYFTLMHSKKLYAWETSPVDDLSVTLLCGECEFKPVSNTIIIDRRIKFQAHPKTIMALKYLRTHLASIISQQFRSRPLTPSQLVWNDLAMQVLGKVEMRM